MRFIKVLLITMLVWAPVADYSVAHTQGEGRTVAAEKSKKTKKAKAKKNKKAKKTAKTKAKAKGKVKAKKARKAARAKSAKSHAPADHLSAPGETGGDPADNFEVSPEMQDELPAPNNGNLTD